MAARGAWEPADSATPASDAIGAPETTHRHPHPYMAHTIAAKGAAAGLAVSQHLALDGVMGAFLAGDVRERDALSSPEVHCATCELQQLGRGTSHTALDNFRLPLAPVLMDLPAMESNTSRSRRSSLAGDVGSMRFTKTPPGMSPCLCRFLSRPPLQHPGLHFRPLCTSNIIPNTRKKSIGKSPSHPILSDLTQFPCLTEGTVVQGLPRETMVSETCVASGKG